jgi:hypothetical protein
MFYQFDLLFSSGNSVVVFLQVLRKHLPLSPDLPKQVSNQLTDGPFHPGAQKAPKLKAEINPPPLQPSLLETFSISRVTVGRDHKIFT